MIDYLINERKNLFGDKFPRYLISSRQLTYKDCQEVFAKADFYRSVNSFSYFGEYRFLNLFNQPSTRTNESFLAAMDFLNISSRVINDFSMTSMEKGETIEDSIQTLANFYDGFIIRNSDENFINKSLKTLINIDANHILISAGTGKLEHPTQALLDLYTMQDSFGDTLSQKKILIVGDISRNRAARSLAFLIPRFRIKHVSFVCIPGYEPEQTIIDLYKSSGINFNIFYNLESTLKDLGRDLDVIYITRLQQEWDNEVEKLGVDDSFILKWEYKKYLKINCKIMHPLPRVNELPREWDNYNHSLYWKQVNNGVLVRAALIGKILEVVK